MSRKRHRHGRMSLDASNDTKVEVTPEMLAQMRHLVGYHFAHELPEDWRQQLDRPVNYIVAGNGIFTYRRTPIADILTESVKLKVPGQPEMKAGTWMRMARVPFNLIAMIVNLFRDVALVHDGAEAYAQVWFNTETGEHWVHVPEQEVSAGAVNHNAVLEREGHRLDLEIHSHGPNMGAFFSGTDDKDESRGGVRIFGVVGRVLNAVPEFKFRMGTGFSEWVELRPADVFEIPDTRVEVSIPLHSVLAGQTTVVVDPFEDVDYPDEWFMAIREKKEYTRVMDAHRGNGAGFTSEMRSDRHDEDDDSILAWGQSYLKKGERLERSPSGVYYVVSATGKRYIPTEQGRLDTLWRMGVREA